MVGAVKVKANLRNANRTGANLTDVEALRQHQLDSACIRKDGDPPTLPEGLKPPLAACATPTR